MVTLLYLFKLPGTKSNLNQFDLSNGVLVYWGRRKNLRNNSKLVKCQEDSSIPCIFIYEADHFEH